MTRAEMEVSLAAEVDPVRQDLWRQMLASLPPNPPVLPIEGIDDLQQPAVPLVARIDQGGLE